VSPRRVGRTRLHPQARTADRRVREAVGLARTAENRSRSFPTAKTTSKLVSRTASEE
jgi:hypothetical protein